MAVAYKEEGVKDISQGVGLENSLEVYFIN